MGSCAFSAPFTVFFFPCFSSIFLFTTFPTRGLAACRYFVHALLSVFQNDLLEQLTARIKTLEDAGSLTDVPARLSRITQYGFRREEDFDKYEALAMAEQLAIAAKLSGHEKAPTFDAIACTLREKLPVSKKHFKAYFVALLQIRSTRKFLKPWPKWISPLSLLSPVQLLAPAEPPVRHLLVQPADVRGSFATLVECLATWLQGVLSGLATEVTHSRVLVPFCRLLEGNRIWICCV